MPASALLSSWDVVSQGYLIGSYTWQNVSIRLTSPALARRLLLLRLRVFAADLPDSGGLGEPPLDGLSMALREAEGGCLRLQARQVHVGQVGHALHAAGSRHVPKLGDVLQVARACHLLQVSNTLNFCQPKLMRSIQGRVVWGSCSVKVAGSAQTGFRADCAVWPGLT